jgi:hypothetical protein
VSSQEVTKYLSPDTPVIVAFMFEGRPLAVNCKVTTDAPLQLFTKDKRIHDVPYPSPVVLVWHREGNVMKGEAEAVGFDPWQNGNVLEIRRTNVKELDRRFYARYPIEVPVSLRAISEMKESTVISISMGITKDVSIGGIWVDVQPTVPLGSVVECKFKLDDEEIWTLAMVAHDNPARGGNGLEFLDFYSDSRDKLERLLKKAA